MINFRSIRVRLTIWYAAWLMTAFVLVGTFMYGTLDRYLQKNLRAGFGRRAHQIESLLLQTASPIDQKWLAQEINSRYTPVVSGRYIRITEARTNIVYVSEAAKEQNIDPAEIPLLENIPPHEVFREETLPNGREFLIEILPLTRNGSNFLIEVGTGRSTIQSVLDQFLLMLAIALPVMIGAAAAGGYVLVRRVLSPVDKITRSAEQITLHNLS